MNIDRATIRSLEMEMFSHFVRFQANWRLGSGPSLMCCVDEQEGNEEGRVRCLILILSFEAKGTRFSE